MGDFPVRPIYMRRAQELFLATAPTFVFAALPMLLVVTATIAYTPLDKSVFSGLLAAVSAGALSILATRILGGSLAARASWLSVFIILLSAYSTVLERLAGASAAGLHENPAFAIAYTLVAGAVASGVRRPWDRSPRRTAMLGALSLAMLAITAVPAIWSATASSARWRDTVETLSAAPLSTIAPPAAPTRDVFYLIFDGLGREDVLFDEYGVGLGALRHDLEQSGFYIPRQSRAPYAQTMLSLSAMLNLDYLDRVSEALGKDSRNRYPLSELLRNNAMMQAAALAGYRVVALESEFAPTSRLRGAEYRTGLGGLSEYQQAAIAMTPLAALPLHRFTFSAHARNVRSQFDALDQLAAGSSAPTFIFAHVLAPHPPFVFEADGSERKHDSSWFTNNDGDSFRGNRADYAPGYASQVQFVAERLRQFLGELSKNQRAEPAVVITGDHGPGSELYWENPAATNMTERMGIFAAYRFPGVSADRFYPTISPVNAARILANSYFGTNLPPLPDDSAFSTWGRPYDFIKLPPEVEK